MEGLDVIVDIFDGELEIFKDVELVVEVKQKYFEMIDNFVGSSLVQVVVEIIVYFFYYK